MADPVPDMDQQDRAAVILAKAQIRIAYIRDRYLVLAGQDRWKGYLQALDEMQRITDIAQAFINACFDDNGYPCLGAACMDEPFRDYVSLLGKLRRICEYQGSDNPRPLEADRFFVTEMRFIMKELDHDQLEDERGNFAPLQGVDDLQPSFSEGERV